MKVFAIAMALSIVMSSAFSRPAEAGLSGCYSKLLDGMLEAGWGWYTSHALALDVCVYNQKIRVK